MADEPLNNDEFSDAHNAEISDEIVELNQKINDLEQENTEIILQNKELKASVEKLTSENEYLKNQMEKAQLESKAMEAVAARAAELEGEVARLHHDLASATSDLQDSNGDVSVLKKELEAAKSLLGAELDGKDKTIEDLKNMIRDLHVLANVEKKGTIAGLGDVEKKGIGGLRDRDWLVLGSTTIAAVAVLGAICYVRAARKH